MRMRKLFASIALFIIATALYGLETIRVGFFVLEPFMIDNGPDRKPTGITIDYYEKFIAGRMGVSIDWIGPLPFVRLNVMLENGELDMIVNLSRTDERNEKFIFPELPQSRIIPCVALPASNPLNEITRSEDLFGKTIGFLVTGYIPPMLIDERITFDLIRNEDYRKINLDKMLVNRIDAVLDINYVSFVHYVKTNGYADKVKILRLPSEPIFVWAMFTRSGKGRRLAAALNRVQKDLDRERIFDTLMHEYLE